MRDISRRLNNAEKKLNLGKEPLVVIITDLVPCEFPEPAEDWVTYPEAVEDAQKQNGVIVLSESKEILARKEQLNASKVQGNV